MGECGCGATNLLATMPGPDGITYGIEVYPGCRYCSTPLGIVVHRMPDDDDIYSMFREFVPELEFVGLHGTDAGAQSYITLLDFDHVSFDPSHQIGSREVRRGIERAVYESVHANTADSEPDSP